jgi:arylsulfatase A-like enzyme
MSIVDVLPTLLAALGEPISPDFDGAVRTDLLAADTSEPRLLSPDEIPPALTRADDVGDADREDEVEQRLADLGYME